MTARRFQRACAAVVALAFAILTLPASALAKPDGILVGAPGAGAKRRVAVLEFRAGAEGASLVGHRLAKILRNLTSLEVMDPDDARRLAGDRVDAALARCAGDTACVGAIGARLHVHEVIVIGVSQFGDLILALQRVKVPTGRVVSRVAESLAKGTEPDDVALEGYLKRLLPVEDFRRYGRVVVRANITGAEVFVSGKLAGMTPIEPLVVSAPARLDLRVVKAGYGDFTARIDVPPEGMVEVRPMMTMGTDESWYQKWWVWAIVGGVAAGAAVGSAMWLLPEDDTVPVEVGGF